MFKKPKSDLDIEESIFDSAANRFSYLELPLSRRIFTLFIVLIISIGLAAMVRVGLLNIIQGEFYRSRAEENINKEINLPAYRGIIVDRFGNPLVKNAPALSVFLDVARVMRDEALLAKTAEKVYEILNIGEDDLKRKIQEADIEKKNKVLLARSISLSQAIFLKSLDIESLRVEDDYQREYFKGQIFAHVLGYTGLVKQDQIKGRSGLEAYYDSLLKGEDGKRVIYRDVKGKIIDEKVVKESRVGQDLKITIDAEFQEYFYNRLRAGLDALKRKAGVGLAIDPRNGEILSLISLPSFDNNVFSSYGRDRERLALLKAANEPLFNRAISGVYSPGSTIKPLIALAALEERNINPRDEIFSPGYLDVPNPYNPEQPSRFLDWKEHGWVNLYSALARSSNVYFYIVGGGLPQGGQVLTRSANAIKGLGIDRLKEYWRRFGFSEKTGIDLIGESKGFLSDPQEKKERTGLDWRLGDTYNVSIGQGDLAVTPIELLSFIASLGNGGKLFKPFLLKDAAPQVLADYSNLKAEINEVRVGLRDAIEKPYGTAYLLNDLPFKAAGKTGSAQVVNNTKINAFFVGYAPIENPRIAILILIEDAREGSLNTVPIAKDVLMWYSENRIVKSF